ncbi:MAG: hypothetical protein KKH67_08480 [candidate division Zixibacteria bacterium]|nr:hypothetical protein [candidate division Zixibacteria bacterium]MBU1471220.1 hypothetical protein [candidate division Zixibacteria bacterium]
MEQITAALIGGFLAAGTGWLLQSRLEASRLSRTKRLLIIGIVDDLKSSIELYSRVIDEWEKSQTIWFTTLNELRESRQTYLKNRDWLVLLKDESFRQRIFKYYHRSTDHINLLESQQRRKYDIQAKLNEVVRDIRLRNESLSLEEERQLVIRAMHAEDRELDGLSKLIPQSIQHLRDYRDEAKDLSEVLEKGKNH